MKRNGNLWIALRLMQGVMILALLMFLFFLTVMGLGIANSSWAEYFIIRDAGQTGSGVLIAICKSCKDPLDQLSSMATAMKWWVLLRGSLFFVLKLSIVWRAIRLLQSVINKRTFYDENIRAFLQMARYGLLIALFSAFNFRYDDDFDNGPLFTWNLDVPFGAIIFTLACKVLADIFSQGRSIAEENKSFI